MIFHNTPMVQNYEEHSPVLYQREIRIKIELRLTIFLSSKSADGLHIV